MDHDIWTVPCHTSKVIGPYGNLASLVGAKYGNTED